MNTQSNFKFIQEEFPILFNIGQVAEYNLHIDPVTTLFKTRLFGEKITEFIFDFHRLWFPRENTFNNRLRDLNDEGLLPSRVRDLIYTIKSKGNRAVHSNEGTIEDAKTTLFAAFKIGKWFYETYAAIRLDISDVKYHLPQKQSDKTKELAEYEKKFKELETKFNKVLEERELNKKLSEEREKEINARSRKAARKIKMTEAETRELIDEQLRQAGWDVDTDILNFKKHKTLPQRGKNIAIAEWRVKGGWADYALFVGLELFAIVEAKKYASDISSDLAQTKRYAKNVQEINNAKLLGEWRTYKVPFLFATNGRPYLEQIKTKSGIWFLDVRERTNRARCLKGWYSPEGLRKLWEQNLAAANQQLKDADKTYLSSKTGLGLRYYQLNAIQAVENQIVNQSSKNRALIAMATGTGKTRTIIGLCYRLIQSNRFKRILFLVDRRLLALQAFNSFKDNRVDRINTFSEIYKISDLKKIVPDIDTRLHFATVQGMVQRLFYNEKDVPPIDTYDCIIVDEAHRGYLMDKELDEDELQFKNQKDYVSKYRMVLDYFDTYAIGLTATPALHTKNIFGKPVFNYSYREAVIDGFLVDHEPPFIIKTKLSEEGILWEKGEKPKAYDKEESKIIELSELEDELKIEIQNFNKLVITDSFNRTVIKQLINHLDPESNEKTLIFAANNAHADKVVNILKEEYAEIGVDLPDEAILKITGSVNKPETWVRQFKNELFPNIVVTVDLLSTGVDIPPISNLVFMRRIRSRILYEQMLGRATRLCPEIGKEVFKIFDAVRLYEGLKDYTDMKPITVNPKTTFKQLVEELDDIQGVIPVQKQVDQILAKFQRKRKYIDKDNQASFKFNSKNKSPEAFIQMMKNLPPAEAQKELHQYWKLWAFMDNLRPSPSMQLFSEHKDAFIAIERGYGKGEKPADYIESFKDFITNNINQIAALDIVCNRPASLDRQSLKELKLILDDNGFNTKALNTAWKSAKNEDIAADIISYIRTLSIGSALVSDEERIQRAMNKVLDMKSNWTKNQLNWIERFKKQLLKEYVLKEEDLEQEPFKRVGGFNKLNKIFRNDLKNILTTLNDELYKVG